MLSLSLGAHMQQGILKSFSLSISLLVCAHHTLVSSSITQYFGQLGFEEHGIGANRNGFSRVCFVVEKKRGKT